MAIVYSPQDYTPMHISFFTFLTLAYVHTILLTPKLLKT